MNMEAQLLEEVRLEPVPINPVADVSAKLA